MDVSIVLLLGDVAEVQTMIYANETKSGLITVQIKGRNGKPYDRNQVVRELTAIYLTIIDPEGSDEEIDEAVDLINTSVDLAKHLFRNKRNNYFDSRKDKKA